MKSHLQGAADRVGAVLAGRYELAQLLGAGGMGAVYRALDRVHEGREVALKVLSARDTIDWFRREFETVSLMNHPSLARVFDFRTDPEAGLHFYTSELCGGKPANLALLAPSFSAIVKFYGSVLDALVYVHGQGYLHCDIKPGNVLVTTDEEGIPQDNGVKVLDFGLALALGKEDGRIRGTMAYMAPEWFSGKPTGPYSDLYSVGVMLYELTYGSLPFNVGDSQACLRFHQEGLFPFEDRSGYPEWWKSILARLLSRDLLERHASARDALSSLYSHLGGGVGPVAALEVAEGSGPFVGRKETLEAARAHIGTGLRKQHRSGSLLVVSGATGVGKSRLLLELKRRLQMEELGVALLQPSLDGADSFSALEALLTGLMGLEPSAHAQDRVDHRVTRLSAALLEYSVEKPIVLLLDDLHRCDLETVGLVLQLLNTLDYRHREQASVHQLALVATVPLDTAAEEGLRALTSHPMTVRATLSALDEAELPRFLSVLLSSPTLPDGLPEELWRTSRGNPLVAVRYLSFLRNQGALRNTPSGLVLDLKRIPEGMEAPGVDAILSGSWSNFLEEEKSLLTVLALELQPQPMTVVARAASMPDWRAHQVLSGLVEQGEVWVSASPRGTFPGLSSPLLRTHLLNDLAVETRLDLHRRLAETLSSFPHAPVSELAYHWVMARQCDRASPLLLPGIRSLIDQASYHKALLLAELASDCGVDLLELSVCIHEIYRLWGRFLEGAEKLGRLLGSLPEGEPGAAIQLRLADLLFRAGRYAESQEKVGPLVDSDHKDVRGEALALCSRIHFYRGEHEEARAKGEQGMLALDEDSREFALCAIMVGLVRVYKGKLTQGVKYLTLARETLSRVGSASDYSFSANALGLAWHKLKDFEEAGRCYRESLEIARGGGDQERMHIALMNLAVLSQETARFGEAIAWYSEVLAMAHQTGNRAVLARILNNLGTLHRYLGLLRKAQSYAEEAWTLGDELGEDHQRGLSLLLLGEVSCYAGEFDAARLQLGQARELFERLGETDEALEVRIDEVECGVLSGLPESVVAAGKETLEACARQGLNDHRFRAALALSWALLEQGSQGGASKAEALLSDLAAEADAVENPELRWRFAGLRAWAADLGEPGEGVDLRSMFQKVDAALGEVRKRVPQEYHAGYFSRQDRRRLLEQFGRMTSRLVATAEPGGPGSPAEASMLAAGQWMSRIVAINRKMLGETSLERLLEGIIDEVVDLSGAERGFVILASGDSDMEAVVARNMDREGIRRSRTKFSTTVARGVLRSGDMVLLENAVEADDYREQQSIMAMRIRSIIALPLTARGAVIGAMYLDNRFREGVFGPQVVEMLKAFAEQAALAVENMRLLENYRRTVDALSQSREEVERLNLKLKEKVRVQEALLRRQSEEIAAQQEQLGKANDFSAIVGRSRAVQGLFAVLTRLKETSVPVLVTGESGTGKELVARALHFNGPRKAHRFVSINCAALPDTLLESELFGYAKGAFTGAVGEKKGLFSLADKGTLFLDEVGDMSLSMQAKLLRVLQEGEFSPLGSEHLLHVDVRIVAATNKDLKSMASQNQFRQDLYYRLDVVSVRVPPLRERKEDIPLLIHHFLEEYARGNSVEAPQMSPDALEALMAHDWPGNIRELHSVVMTSAVFAQSGVITLESLRTKPEVLQGRSGSSRPSSLPSLNIRELESMAIQAAIEQCNGNKLQAARVLGISRRALYNKLGYGEDRDN